MGKSKMGRRHWTIHEEDFVRFMKTLKVRNPIIAMWLGRTDTAIKVRWDEIRWRDKGQTKHTPGTRRQRRFEHHYRIEPEKIIGLADDHPAVTEGRTMFPTTVVPPHESKRLLVGGDSQRKLGSRVMKGPWKGMFIYHLTLEERATCPRYCTHWTTCYGNAMHRARRHKNDFGLEGILEDELSVLNRKHPGGFVIRLHTLGDFYSSGYAVRWALFLDKFENLHIFGYTARTRDTMIGKVLTAMNQSSRCYIRFSNDYGPMGSATLWEKAEGTIPAEGNKHAITICPAQTDGTACCATCGLCWHPAMRDRVIGFMAHGARFVRKDVA